MKSATIPSLRVEPELRAAAEQVLLEGETLSTLVEKSLRAQIAARQAQAEFIKRGLKSRDEAQRRDEYIDADTVHAELRAMLNESTSTKSTRRR